MLRKKDLAKEFELVVKQEVKNHNDAILATNIAINTISEKIENLHKKHDAFIEKGKEKDQKYYADMQKLSDNFEERLQTMVKGLNNVIEKIEGNLINTFDTLHNTFDNFAKKRELTEIYTIVQEELSKIKKKLDDQFSTNSASMVNLTSQMTKLINSLKEIHEENIKDIQSQIDTIRESQKIQKIDKDGIQRELEIIKKTVFINEKKIEHLYILNNEKIGD